MLKKSLPYLFWLFLLACFLVGSGMLFLQSNAGQRWVSRQVNDYVSKNFQTTFHAQIRYRIPDWLEFQDVYLADQNQDTLLAVKSLRLDLDVWDIWNKKISVDQLILENGYVRLVDQNYQFLLAPSPSTDTTSAGWPITFEKIQVKNTKIDWKDPQTNAKSWIGHLETTISILPTQYRVGSIKLENAKFQVTRADVPTTSPSSDTTTGELPDLQLTDLHAKNLDWLVAQKGNPGWSTHGKADRLHIRVKSLNLPALQGELEAIQGRFPVLAWGEERLEDIQMDVPQIGFTPEKQHLWVRGLGFKHPKGLEITTGFQVNHSAKSIQISQFRAQTPDSDIRLEGKIQSPSHLPWSSLSPEDWILKLDNPFGKIAWRDLHVFFPDLLPSQAGHIRFTHAIQGDGKTWHIQNIQYEGPSGSRLALSGKIRQTVDWKTISGRIQLKELSLPDARWHALVPKNIRTTYQLPGTVRLTGQIEGNGKKADWVIQTTTSLGTVQSVGSYLPGPDVLETQINWQHVAIGKLVKQDSLGPTSGQGTLRVTQLLKESRSIDVATTLEEASYGKLEVRQLHAAGTYQSPRFNGVIRSEQAGFSFDLQTEGQFKEVLQWQGRGILRDLDLKKWAGTPSEVHLTAPIAWSGQIPLDQLTQATGYIQLDQAQWRKEGELTNTQPMRLDVQRSGNRQTVELQSGFLNAHISGTYHLDRVATELTRFLGPYFHLLPDSSLAPFSQEQFTLRAEVRPDPWLAFISDHTLHFQPISIQGYFNSEIPEKTYLTWDLKNLQWDSLKLDQWKVSIQPRGDSLRLDSEIQGLQQGSLRLNQANIAMAASQDLVKLGIQVRDSVGQPIHRVGLQLEQVETSYFLSLDPNGWQIYYEDFQSMAGGRAILTSKGIEFDSLGLRKGRQELLVHSAPQNPWNQWFIRARDISLKTWTATFLRDTTLLDGQLQADITLLNPLQQPTYVGDVSIDNLAVFQIPLGTFEGHSTNRSEDEIAFDAQLKGAGNEVTLQGTYATNGRANPVEATLDIERLTAATLQTFSFGQLRNSKGYVQGLGRITGSFDQPTWEGNLRFLDYQTTVAMSGTTLKMNNQQIRAKDKIIYFDNFQIQDTLQNILAVQGTLQQTESQGFKYQLNARTTDFLATNARRTDNAFFYGTAYLDADVQINGYNTQYQVRGNIRVADKTRLTAYMPPDEQVGSELNQLVYFVPPSSAKKEPEAREKSIKRESTFDPSTLTLNLSVSEKAELTLIMDEMTGDYLKVRGNGQMTTGLDAQGDLFILGRFNVKEGIYRMTYQVFERQFVIDESSQSSITWRGDPTDADIQITASYKVNKPLATYPFTGKDLSKDPRLQRQVPFSVDLVLKGDLLAPQTSFALSMAKEYVERQLGGDISTLLEDEGFLLVEKDRIQGRVTNPKAEANAEKIKEQAIYMLMFGRFDILGKRLTTGLDAEGFARKQVSQLISDQLDRLASDIIKGVDLDVGVQSESGVDHSNRSTNLNLGVKKAFLNDRISISVGKNFELESAQRQSNELFDHLTANYNITRDGRYRFKAFRSNQYQIEGFVVETGVGFVLTLDYDDRRDIFRRSLPKIQP